MTTTQKVPDRPQNISFLAAFGASLGGLLYGYDTGIIGSALIYLKTDFGISGDPLMQSVITASTLLGAILGALAFGPIADRLGRRRTILAIALLFGLFSIGSGLAWDSTSLTLMRFLLGLAVGGSSQLVPMYIAELAPVESRGAQGVLFQVMIGLGTLLAFLAGFLLAPYAAWEWMLGLAAAPSLLFMLIIYRLPESPRWLVAHQRIDQARATLESVGRTTDQAQREIADIQNTEGDTGAGWGALFAPWVRPSLIAALGVAILSQATGISAIIYYAPSLLELARFDPYVAIQSSLGIGIALTLATGCGIFLLDRVGRRRLILIGLPLSALSLAVLTYFLPWNAASAYTPTTFDQGMIVAALLAYFIFNGGSLSVVAWLYFAEVFPLALRSKGTALSAFTLWVTNFAVTLFLYFFADRFGVGLIFTVLTAINVVAWIFAIFYIPETKGRSLEDIESDLHAGTFSVR